MDSQITHRREVLEQRYPVWVPRTIAQHLSDVAEREPTRPWVLSEQHSYSYVEMRDWSRRIARGLIAWGVKPGEHVAMVIANSPEHVAVRTAISAIGAVAIPLSEHARTGELRALLDQSDAVLLVAAAYDGSVPLIAGVDPSGDDGPEPARLRGVIAVGEVPDAATAPMSLEELSRLGDTVSEAIQIELETNARPDDVAEIVYTSGSTGMPKGVMLTHDSLLRSAYADALCRGLGEGHRIYFSLPLNHNFAHIQGLLAATFVGGAVVPHAKFDAQSALAAMARFAVNEALFVPTMTIALLEAMPTDHDLSALYAMHSAGAPTPTRLWESAKSSFGLTQLTTGYGQTEVGAATCYVYPGDPTHLLTESVGRPKVGGVADPDSGRPLVEYRTIDTTTMEFQPDGEQGELVVRGPLCMQGYYNRPEENAAAFFGEWIRTGDVGWIDDEGYLRLTGRVKELYKTGGELVAPAEVETFLTSQPEIAQAYVVGVPDERWGEIGCAWVVCTTPISPEEIIARCKQSLARYKVPKQVFLVDFAQLPTTSTGKIQKPRLVEMTVRRVADSAAPGVASR